jgi:hypothetical protein
MDMAVKYGDILFRIKIYPFQTLGRKSLLPVRYKGGKATMQKVYILSDLPFLQH